MELRKQRTQLLLVGIIIVSFILTTGISHAQTPWTKYAENPVLSVGESGEWDDSVVGTATVLLDNGTYKMWYGGGDGSVRRIGYATSSNGTSLAKHPTYVLEPGSSGAWDDVSVGQPTVLLKDGMYHMWYDGFDGTDWRIDSPFRGEMITPSSSSAFQRCP